MKKALKLAFQAFQRGEVPVGAILCRIPEEIEYRKKKNTTVDHLDIVAEAYNQCEKYHSALYHAECLVLKKASEKLGQSRLTHCVLYVTLEPCFMCAGAIALSRIQKLIFGASDPKGGAVGSIYNVFSNPRLNHRPEVIKGILSTECSEIMTNFFELRRKENKKNKVLNQRNIRM